MADIHANFASGRITVAPSPATSGTTFSMSNSDAANFPDPSGGTAYNLTIWAANQNPLSTNAEIVRVTAKGAADSGGTGNTQFTMTRLAEQNFPATMTARSIQVGDWVAANVTKKWLTDIEGAVVATTSTIKTVNTTVSETTLLGTAVGNLTLPANFFVVGRTLRFVARGYLGTFTSGTLNIKIKLGSTIIKTKSVTMVSGQRTISKMPGMNSRGRRKSLTKMCWVSCT